MRPTVPTCLPGTLVTTRFTISTKARGGQERVVSIVHRRGAGVVLESRDVTSHCLIPTMPGRRRCRSSPTRACRPARCAARSSRDIALASLGLIELRDVAADERDALLHRLAAVGDGLELGRRDLPAHRAAAKQASLLVLPDHDFDRVLRDDVVLGEGLCDFDRAHRPDVAVVVAALRHRIDVRPEQQRLERRVAAGATADDVAGRVDRRSSFAARIQSITTARAARSASL